MTPEDAVSWLLIALALVDWFATAILVYLALRERVAALEERATVSVLLSAGATGAAVLGGARLTGIPVPDGLAFVLLAFGLVILSVPQLVWVIAYWLGRFR